MIPLPGFLPQQGSGHPRPSYSSEVDRLPLPLGRFQCGTRFRFLNLVAGQGHGQVLSGGRRITNSVEEKMKFTYEDNTLLHA
jgi:hypothetical protein